MESQHVLIAVAAVTNDPSLLRAVEPVRDLFFELPHQQLEVGDFGTRLVGSLEPGEARTRCEIIFTKLPEGLVPKHEPADERSVFGKALHYFLEVNTCRHGA